MPAFVAMAATTVILAGQLGREHQLLDQFNALLAVLLLILLGALACALLLRDRVGIIIAALGFGLGGYQLGSSALHTVRAQPESGATTFKVLTLSTYHANPTPAEIARVITAENPDVAVLQETGSASAKVVEDLLPHFHRVQSCRKSPCQLTTLSRWPIERVHIGKSKHGFHADLLIGTVTAPFGTFQVMNVHLKRPYHPQAQTLLAETAQLVRQQEKRPFLIAGDFNTTTGSFGLARFERASGVTRFNGWIPTYPANRLIPAFTGIDHIYGNTHWANAGCHRIAGTGSDHHGVACRVSLQRQPSN